MFFFCKSVCLFVYLSVCLSFHQSIGLSPFCVSVCLSVVYLHACVCPSVYFSISPSVHIHALEFILASFTYMFYVGKQKPATCGCGWREERRWMDVGRERGMGGER